MNYAVSIPLFAFQETTDYPQNFLKSQKNNSIIFFDDIMCKSCRRHEFVCDVLEIMFVYPARDFFLTSFFRWESVSSIFCNELSVRSQFSVRSIPIPLPHAVAIVHWSSRYGFSSFNMLCALCGAISRPSRNRCNMILSFVFFFAHSVRAMRCEI